MLDVATVGYLIPRGGDVWRVHSVFANACNFRCDDLLLTLVTPRLGGGPTTMVLRRPLAQDLRGLFVVGERVHPRGDALYSQRTVVHLSGARTWQALATRKLLGRRQIEANLALARERLAQSRQRCTSVIDGQARPLVDALGRATRGLDGDEALRLLARFVGWGEGLTPAGDDFLVGWIAGLDALAFDAARQQFRAIVGSAFACFATRTTPVAAHFLRLAAGGHYVEVLDRLRDALLCESCPAVMTRAAEAALDVGATSGADMLAGLLCALGAWLPAATEH